MIDSLFSVQGPTDHKTNTSLAVSRFRGVGQQPKSLRKSVTVVGSRHDGRLNDRNKLAFQLLLVSRRRQRQALRVAWINWKLHIVGKCEYADLYHARYTEQSINRNERGLPGGPK